MAIAGNIGAGKTTLAEMLASHLDWQVLYEKVENNPYLSDFYTDMKKWAFPLQIYFLSSRFEQIKQIQQMDRSVIQDRTIYEDAHVFAKSLFAQGIMSQRDYSNYLLLFKSMLELTKPPDLIIYLKSNIQNLQYNIKKRNRKYESGIDDQYLIHLNEHYENWIGNFSESKVITINAHELDYVNRFKDFQQILEVMAEYLNES